MFRILLIAIVLIFSTSVSFGQLDIGVDSVYFNSGNSCYVTGTDSITIRISNFGAVPIDSFPVFYQINGGTIVSETYDSDTIQPGLFTFYTFLKTVDLTKPYDLQLSGWTTAAGDANSNNDTLTVPIDCICSDSTLTEYVCNQLVVKYFSTTTAFDRDTIRDNAESLGISILDSVICDGIFLDLWSAPDTIFMDGDTIIDIKTQKECLRNSDAGTETIDLNTLPNASAITSPSTQQVRQQLTTYQEKLQQNNSTNGSLKIVVLDTGVDTLSDFFSNKKLDVSCATCPELPDITLGYDYVNNDFDPSDDQGHGTKVTNLLADYTNTYGITNLNIIPIKVLNQNGRGSLWDISLGVLTASKLNADIINASFGWQGDSSTILQQLIAIAGDNCRGLFVTSAGNDSTSNDSIPHWPSNYSLYLDNVLSVTSLRDDGTTQTLAPYANFGIKTTDVATQGRFLVSGINDVETFEEGTSLSTAHISAQAVRLLDETSSLSAKQLKNLFKMGPTLPNIQGQVTVLSFILPSDISQLSTWAGNLTIDPNCQIIDCVLTSTNQVFANTETLTFKTYPNPFTNDVLFEFNFDEAEDLRLRVYDTMGRLVYAHNADHIQGTHQIQWNGQLHGVEVPNGIYICHIQTKKGQGKSLFVKQK